MKTINIYYIIAGVINLFTALLHTIGGQIGLINPFLESNLENQTKTELLGVWHMVTVMLFASSFIFIHMGFKQKEKLNTELPSFISYLYILFSAVFIIVSLLNETLAPQWILLLPIGILGLLGVKKTKSAR